MILIYCVFPFQVPDESCIICGKGFDKENVKVTLGERGSSGINKSSDQLGEDIHAELGDFVHKQCRVVYTNKNVIASKLQKGKHASTPKKRPLRSCTSSADSPTCLFCGQVEKIVKKVGKNSIYGKFIPVRTKTQFQESVLEHCSKRNDTWSRDVKAKIEYMQDCFAHDVVYHNVCYSNFRTGCQVPKVFSKDEPPKKKRCFAGRPENERTMAAFQHVIKYLDSIDDEQVTIRDLVMVMEKKLKTSEEEGSSVSGNAYSSTFMKQKLKDYYGDGIVISGKRGTADVVTLKQTASAILHDFNQQPKPCDPEIQKLRLIKTAADLILSDIKSLSCTKESYPDIASMDDQASILPDTLKAFLSQVFKGKEAKVKLEAIGQAIVQSARPRSVIAPLQIGLAVQMHKVFGSRFLIDTLNHLGFSSSYTEVQKFQLNAAAQQGIDLPPAKGNDTIQFVADNVDHNSATLDGHNTFHGMGIIAVTTPGASQEGRQH